MSPGYHECGPLEGKSRPRSRPDRCRSPAVRQSAERRRAAAAEPLLYLPSSTRYPRRRSEHHTNREAYHAVASCTPHPPADTGSQPRRRAGPAVPGPPGHGADGPPHRLRRRLVAGRHDGAQCGRPRLRPRPRHRHPHARPAGRLLAGCGWGRRGAGGVRRALVPRGRPGRPRPPERRRGGRPARLRERGRQPPALRSGGPRRLPPRCRVDSAAHPRGHRHSLRQRPAGQARAARPSRLCRARPEPGHPADQPRLHCTGGLLRHRRPPRRTARRRQRLAGRAPAGGIRLRRRAADHGRLAPGRLLDRDGRPPPQPRTPLHEPPATPGCRQPQPRQALRRDRPDILPAPPRGALPGQRRSRPDRGLRRRLPDPRPAAPGAGPGEQPPRCGRLCRGNPLRRRHAHGDRPGSHPLPAPHPGGGLRGRPPGPPGRDGSAGQRAERRPARPQTKRRDPARAAGARATPRPRPERHPRPLRLHGPRRGTGQGRARL